jgi:hypothetical protein
VRILARSNASSAGIAYYEAGGRVDAAGDIHRGAGERGGVPACGALNDVCRRVIHKTVDKISQFGSKRRDRS